LVLKQLFKTVFVITIFIIQFLDEKIDTFSILKIIFFRYISNIWYGKNAPKPIERVRMRGGGRVMANYGF
jgi:hypothetical protein